MSAIRCADMRRSVRRQCALKIRAAATRSMWGRLEALPPRQRTVLVLRYYEGLTDAEISEVLGTPPATVRSHASRALATLRDTDLSTRPEQR